MRDEEFLSDEIETDEAERSLLEDLETAIADGKTYLEAEIAYQRTRAALTVERARDAALFAALGGALALLALVALTIGVVIALVPLLTAWGAAATVTGVWLLLSVIFLRMAATRWHKFIASGLVKPESDE